MNDEYFYSTYANLLSFCSFELKKISNIKKFCEQHDIDPQLAYRIKNGNTNNKCSKVVIKILTILGYEISADTYYLVKKPEKINYEREN